MKIPESIKDELSPWNNGRGIDLEDWIGIEGNFKLAIGYASIIWPAFVEFEDYIFREGFSKSSVRGFESYKGSTPKSVEWTMNHHHIAGIQVDDCEDISRDKIVALGNTLKEIYEAKLKINFPDKPCIVEFYQPEDISDLMDYQISFWQVKHEPKIA